MVMLRMRHDAYHATLLVLGRAPADSAEAKQYKRPDMNEDLRLGFASNLRRNEVEEPDGHREVERRHGDGHPRLLSPACSGGEGPCSSSFLGQTKLFRTCGTHGSCTDLRGSATSTTQAMAFKALKVQAPRPRALGKSAAEGPNDRLRPTLSTSARNTIAQVDGLLAEAESRRQPWAADSALSDKVVAVIGADPGRLAVKLDGLPQQRLQRGPGHAHRMSGDGYTLTLAANPWNIVAPTT